MSNPQPKNESSGATVRVFGTLVKEGGHLVQTMENHTTSVFSSSESGGEVIDSVVRGGKHERKETNSLRVVDPSKSNTSGGRAIGTLVEDDGQMIETIDNTMSFYGSAPSADLVRAFRNSTPQQSSQQRTNQQSTNQLSTNRTSKVSFKVRLVDLKESLNFTYPETTKVKEVLEEIRTTKGVDVALRREDKTDLSPNNTLKEEKVRMNQTLHAKKVQIQNTASAVGSGNAVRE